MKLKLLKKIQKHSWISLPTDQISWYLNFRIHNEAINFELCDVIIEAVVQRCSVKKVFLEISQNSQENTCARVFFNKVAGLRPYACNFIKNETLAQMFSYEFCEISKTPFFIEHLWWLLLISRVLPYMENAFLIISLESQIIIFSLINTRIRYLFTKILRDIFLAKKITTEAIIKSCVRSNIFSITQKQSSESVL